MDKILVLDFGGQYNQLIARRVRENHVYCEVLPHSTPLEKLLAEKPKGIIFTGGPNSVYDPASPKIDARIFDAGIPIFGICYGCQLMAQTLGGEVIPAQEDTAREFGKTETTFDTTCAIFRNVPQTDVVWMSHGDYMARLPEGFRVTATTAHCPNGAIADESRKLYGVQFHPEVTHSVHGAEMLCSFLFDVCHCTGDWTMSGYLQSSIATLRETIGDGRVLLALSGGVDSSVAAALLSEAVGEKLVCVFVDHGLLRKNEADEVEAAFADRKLKLIRVDAQERFLSKLAGVSEPERKRKIIGEEFIRVFEEEAKKIGRVEFLAQGTIYPDVIESGMGKAAVIKSHHNVGGLPDHVDFKQIVEPLRLLFKDEVRALGRELGLPEELVSRQPFPGPGLAIRVIGEVTKERLEILRDADAIFREEVEKLPPAERPNQYFAALTNLRSVGVMGDGRTYDCAIGLRAVTTGDFMTATWTHLPYETLDRAATRIVNEVAHVNRILYDVTGKPPATIEWE